MIKFRLCKTQFLSALILFTIGTTIVLWISGECVIIFIFLVNVLLLIYFFSPLRLFLCFDSDQYLNVVVVYGI